MPVFRVERNKGYTVMSNYHLRDKSLSLKAKGLLSQILSLPEDWDYTLSGLCYINRESKDAIRMTGWMSRMSDEQESACPTREYGYIHCLTLPRVLSWEHETLYQRPVQEVYSLRRNARTYDGTRGSFQAENGHFELFLKRTDAAAPLSLSLRNHTVDIAYWPETRVLRVTRQNWVGGGVQSREAVLPELNQINIFSDASSAEIFVNDGAAVFSMRYFTGGENLRIEYAGLLQGERLEYYTL